MEHPPCIYPTFTKAKNLALAYALETKQSRILVKLPTEATGWVKHFKTVDVSLLRTANFMATITSYGYKDYKAGAKSKYMYRPAGGAISCLWVKDHGLSDGIQCNRILQAGADELPGSARREIPHATNGVYR